jgi:hypothetical protein
VAVLAAENVTGEVVQFANVAEAWHIACQIATRNDKIIVFRVVFDRGRGDGGTPSLERWSNRFPLSVDAAFLYWSWRNRLAKKNCNSRNARAGV